MYNVTLEVLTTLHTNNLVFWDVIPCSLVEACRSFGGTRKPEIQSTLKIESGSSAEASVVTIILHGVVLQSIIYVLTFLSRALTVARLQGSLPPQRKFHRVPGAVTDPRESVP